jgi:hypothetical protein
VADEGLLDDILNRPAVRQGRGGEAITESMSLDRLPPTEKFLESGFGWFTGSRTMDMYRLSWRLWNKYGDENVVFGLIVKCYDTTPNVDGFPWKKVHDHVRIVERQWSEQRLALATEQKGWQG